MKPALIFLLLSFSFMNNALAEDKISVTQNINISDNTIKYICVLNSPINETPDWIELCAAITIDFMVESMEKGHLHIEGIPENPYILSSQDFNHRIEHVDMEKIHSFEISTGLYPFSVTNKDPLPANKKKLKKIINHDNAVMFILKQIHISANNLVKEKPMDEGLKQCILDSISLNNISRETLVIYRKHYTEEFASIRIDFPKSELGERARQLRANKITEKEFKQGLSYTDKIELSSAVNGPFNSEFINNLKKDKISAAESIAKDILSECGE